LQVAGGLLVARTAWEMGNSHSPSLAEVAGESPTGRDISLIPMAIPIISGPGAIGMAIALAAQNPYGFSYLGSLLGMGTAGGHPVPLPVPGRTYHQSSRKQWTQGV
jgi:multiple antibiotic resistance protein